MRVEGRSRSTGIGRARVGALLSWLLLSLPGQAPAADTPAVPSPDAATTTPLSVPGSIPADSAASIKTYALYPGDLIQVQVYDNPDLDVLMRVPASGAVVYPLIGAIERVVGRRIEEVTAEITRRLMDSYLRQAVVTITVREFAPRSAYVMGSIKQPGAVELNPLTVVTAMQAIGKAGGFSDDADRAGAQIIRDDPAAPGGKIALAIPGTDKTSDLMMDTALDPGDLLIVPRLDRVYIIGQVIRPGAVNLPSQEVLTVSKAISLSGGFDRFAKQGDVLLMRAGQKVQTVDVRAILGGDTGKADPALKPGDTVYVPESRF